VPRNDHQAYILLGIYEKQYADKYGLRPKRLNRYRDKWAMVDVMETVGFDRTAQLIDYYFKVDRPGHPLIYFFNNFDRLDEALSLREADDIKRAKIRQETKERLEREQ
jgi:hypothetical protein